jgi:hypothetical protein
MKIIGGTDKDKEDEARKRADALAKAIIKMLPQHLSHRELLAASRRCWPLPSPRMGPGKACSGRCVI